MKSVTCIYLYFKNLHLSPIKKTRPLNKDYSIIADYNEKNEIIGIEFLSMSSRQEAIIWCLKHGFMKSKLEIIKNKEDL